MVLWYAPCHAVFIHSQLQVVLRALKYLLNIIYSECISHLLIPFVWISPCILSSFSILSPTHHLSIHIWWTGLIDKERQQEQQLAGYEEVLSSENHTGTNENTIAPLEVNHAPSTELYIDHNHSNTIGECLFRNATTNINPSDNHSSSALSIISSYNNPFDNKHKYNYKQISPTQISWTLYISGMIGMTFLNPLCCVLAMKYANPSILAPFSGLTLVWVVLFSGRIVGETPGVSQKVACALIILGEVLVAMFGDHTNGEEGGGSVEEVVSSCVCILMDLLNEHWLGFEWIHGFCWLHFSPSSIFALRLHPTRSLHFATSFSSWYCYSSSCVYSYGFVQRLRCWESWHGDRLVEGEHVEWCLVMEDVFYFNFILTIYPHSYSFMCNAFLQHYWLSELSQRCINNLINRRSSSAPNLLSVRSLGHAHGICRIALSRSMHETLWCNILSGNVYCIICHISKFDEFCPLSHLWAFGGCD